MHSLEVNCWFGVFTEAYKYCSTYLIFALTLVLTSIFMAWVRDRPRLYKIIFKRSKHSNILSPVVSEVQLPESVQDTDFIDSVQKPREVCKDNDEL